MLSTLRSRLTYANVVASLALFLALGGTSVAAVSLSKNSVGSKQIKNSSLTGSDVKNSSLTTSDIKNKSLLAKDFKKGQLPAGARGAKGATGETGGPGLSGYQVVKGPETAADTIPNKTATVTCPSGKKVISATFDSGANSGNGFATMTRVTIADDGQSAKVSARKDDAGASTWSIIPAAVCAATN